MLIPVGVDVPFDRRPFLNWLVVIMTVVFFGFEIAAIRTGGEGAIDEFLLDGYGLTGIFGHMWIHAGLLHLIGNMIFLWVFGNAVCSKIGNVLYLPVYILLGLAAAVVFNVFSDGRALGASGAVNGIVGMYLVFFPLNDVTCFWLIHWRSGEFSVSSFWMILFWLAFDIFGVVTQGVGVAYVAHLGGFFVGMAIAVILLKLRIVQMEEDERSLLQVISGDNDKELEEDRLWEMRHNSSHLHQELYRAENEFDQAGAEGNKDDFWKAYAPEKKVIIPEVQMEKVPEVQSADGYIRFYCECGKKLKVPDSYAGKNGKCPRCSARMRVPG